MKIAILISGRGSNMQAIAQAISAGKLNADIIAVISNQPQCEGLNTAQAMGIKTLIVDSSQYISRAEYDTALAVEIHKLQPDYIVLAGFMRILTPEFVQEYSHQLLNIHPSLLPKYKGLNTHQRVLSSTDLEHGTSVHFVTPELDGGPIIAQVKIPLNRGIRPPLAKQIESLKSHIQNLEYKLYPLCLYWLISEQLSYCSGKIRFNGQVLPPQSGIQFTEQQLAQAWSEI